MLEYLVELLGTDIFTTHELWDIGIDRIYDPEPWPPQLKMQFKRLRKREDLAHALRHHPRVEQLENFEEHSHGLRTRTKLWQLHE